ncbi:hypothetical protein LSCM1_06638 [Leishmania martiniquensis]|uniref:Uncharacterized protein n=1 Tax=Leishmania martiniquensis TaxID=1580590 RepID=A0A836GMN5_9TRYP|nr:hypothetical protein LSCM1_06638 [Leishmania martiniquensis]
MARTTSSASRTRRPTGGERWCGTRTAPPTPCSRGGPRTCTRKVASAKARHARGCRTRCRTTNTSPPSTRRTRSHGPRCCACST